MILKSLGLLSENYARKETLTVVFKLFLCGIKDSRKFVFWTQSNIYDAFNQFQPSVAFDRETSHLICKANEMTGFYIKCNNGLQWVNLKFNGYSKQKFFKIYFNSFKYVNWINKGNIYLFKVNNWNIRKRGEICSKLIIKRAEPRQWRHLLFLLWTLNIFHTFFWCFYCWL